MKTKNFFAMTDEERTAAFAAMDNEALTASLTEARTEATAAFASTEVTPDFVTETEALVASIGLIEAEQADRAKVAKEAADRFAAARAAFSAEGDESDEAEGDESDEAEGDEADEAEGDESDEADESDESEVEGDTEVEAETVAASVNHSRTQAVKVPAASTAKKVAARTKRPAKADTSKVVITASAGVPDFANGSVLEGMTDVAKAVQGQVKGFAPWSERQAQALQSQGITTQLVKAPVAQFAVAKTNDLTNRSGVAAEYDAVGEAVKAHVERVNDRLKAAMSGNSGALAAAMAWCSPSEVVYNWIADFVVDGLLDLPEISAPRGGLMLTEGPHLAQESYGQEANFGFGGTETEMEAGYVKTCETIECPDFVDHRLDFDGYCWKIPILTESTFPELVADALKTSDLLYAHKMNHRRINDVLAGSVARGASGIYGGSLDDTLEALVQIATKERRWWNLGENAVMEVKLPQWAREVFMFDMQRRTGLALNDVATEQKVAAYFANYHLAVTYLSDFDERTTSAHPTAGWPPNLRAIIYPAGTFVQAQKDVISISAVHDAASLSHNEYTGVFYEQGIKTIRRGYRSTVVTVPVCTAGMTGAAAIVCETRAGSF